MPGQRFQHGQCGKTDAAGSAGPNRLRQCVFVVRSTTSAHERSARSIRYLLRVGALLRCVDIRRTHRTMGGLSTSAAMMKVAAGIRAAGR
jgi:hypothetical protein